MIFSRAESIFACLRPSDASFCLDRSRRDPFLADFLLLVVVNSLNGWKAADASLLLLDVTVTDDVGALSVVASLSSLRVAAQALREEDTAVGSTCFFFAFLFLFFLPLDDVVTPPTETLFPKSPFLRPFNAEELLATTTLLL